MTLHKFLASSTEKEKKKKFVEVSQSHNTNSNCKHINTPYSITKNY